MATRRCQQCLRHSVIGVVLNKHLTQNLAHSEYETDTTHYYYAHHISSSETSFIWEQRSPSESSLYSRGLLWWLAHSVVHICLWDEPNPELSKAWLSLSRVHSLTEEPDVPTQLSLQSTVNKHCTGSQFLRAPQACFLEPPGTSWNLADRR